MPRSGQPLRVTSGFWRQRGALDQAYVGWGPACSSSTAWGAPTCSGFAPSCVGGSGHPHCMVQGTGGAVPAVWFPFLAFNAGAFTAPSSWVCSPQDEKRYLSCCAFPARLQAPGNHVVFRAVNAAASQIPDFISLPRPPGEANRPRSIPLSNEEKLQAGGAVLSEEYS